MKILITGFDPFGGEKINPAIPIESSSIPDEQREITIAKSNVAILNHTTFT